MICIECNRDRQKYAKQLCYTCYDRHNRKRGSCDTCNARTCREKIDICQPCRNRRDTPFTIGHTHSPEAIEKIKEARKRQFGYKCPAWKGGVTAKNKLLRESSGMRTWRISIFERDDYTCALCSTRGGTLNADHIKPFALYPELRLELSNGRTLCIDCHSKTPTYGVNVKS